MTKRWHKTRREDVEDPKVEAFLAEVVEVCKRHGMSISHEDTQGAFIVGRRFGNERDDEDLLAAHIMGV